MNRRSIRAITLAIRVTWNTPLRSPVCRLAEAILDAVAQRQLAA